MDAVMFTLPIALAVASVFLGLFYWAFRQGQFDNPEGPAERMIHDNDDAPLVKKQDAALKTPESGK